MWVKAMLIMSTHTCVDHVVELAKHTNALLFMELEELNINCDIKEKITIC